MFRFIRDNGEKREFEYEDEYTLGRSGKIRRTCPPPLGEEARAVLSDAFYAIAEQLERDAEELRRRGKDFDDDDAFGAMVSGS